MPYKNNSPEQTTIKIAGTYAHFSNKSSPTVICLLFIGNSVFVGESSSEDRDLHETVKTWYGEVPRVYRSVNSGRCAEAEALSKALKKGFNLESLSKAKCQAVIVNSKKLVPPCQSCDQVLRRLRVSFKGHANINPVMEELIRRFSRAR